MGMACDIEKTISDDEHMQKTAYDDSFCFWNRAAYIILIL